MKKRLLAVVSAVMLSLSVPLPVSAETAENEDKDIMTVSVVDYDTGELILTDTDQEWAITLQAGFSVVYVLLPGVTDGEHTTWINLNAWSYGSLNPCEIDISYYGTVFSIEGFRVVDMYIPDGYFLPEDYLEMNYKESDTDHTDFPSDITVKLKKTTMGDVNDDGAFNVSDVVLLQKWLLAVPDTHLANWKAADFCEDDVLNVFDLCLMKRALIEQRQQRQITIEDIISLSKKGYDLTVADFAPFKGENIGSGLYVMKYEVAGREDQYYLLVGSDGSDKPDYAKLVNLEKDGKWDEIDIRSEEMQKAVEVYENWNKGTDTEENRVSAMTLGDYALAKLKDGTYSLDTVIDSENASELMNEGTAALMDKDEFTSMEFLDEHTVMIDLNYGLLGVQGYLVTDGTVTFEPNTQVSVPNKGFDGDVINIEWADGNLYYFTAGL